VSRPVDVVSGAVSDVMTDVVTDIVTDDATNVASVSHREQNELHERRNSLQNEKKELWSQEDSIRRYTQLHLALLPEATRHKPCHTGYSALTILTVTD